MPQLCRELKAQRLRERVNFYGLCLNLISEPWEIEWVSFIDVKFKADIPLLDLPLTMTLKDYDVIPEEDVPATTSIIQRCLQLNLKDRATAMELLSDLWW